jgi:hypothetical protein
LDLFSRRIVGWAMSERMTSDLTLRALRMAIRRRQPDPGLIHHSDRAPVCSFVFSGGDSVPCGGGNCSASYPKVERLMGTKRDVRKKGSEGSIKPSSSLRASSTRRKLDCLNLRIERDLWYRVGTMVTPTLPRIEGRLVATRYLRPRDAS